MEMLVPLEVGVYSIAFVASVVASATFYVAERKFAKGEFKEFISWVMSASVAFLLGSLLNLAAVSLAGSAYGTTMLAVAGFAYVLMGACFIRAAFLLHDMSKVFGFAWMQEGFGESGAAKKPAVRRPGRRSK